MATIKLNGKELATGNISAESGFVDIRTSSFIHTAFDDFEITYGELITLLPNIVFSGNFLLSILETDVNKAL